MGRDFRDTLNERLQDPDFKAAWDEMEPERQIMQAIVEGREDHHLNQAQLSKAKK